MNVRNEMETVNAQEQAKQDRKDAMFEASFQGMTSEEIAEYLRLEKERWEAERLEMIAEESWQAWNGNPLYLSREDRKLHEVALDHEAIEMSLMA
jgi:hypothetical protein